MACVVRHGCTKASKNVEVTTEKVEGGPGNKVLHTRSTVKGFFITTLFTYFTRTALDTGCPYAGQQEQQDSCMDKHAELENRSKRAAELPSRIEQASTIIT